jgi:hypothetical protein
MYMSQAHTNTKRYLMCTNVLGVLPVAAHRQDPKRASAQQLAPSIHV